MATIATDLPVDVLELIIDEVACLPHAERFPTLKSCALTCKMFLKPCQRHLFRAIKLHFCDTLIHEICSERFNRLQNLLKSSPDLTLLVRVLVLSFADVESTNVPGLADCIRSLTRIRSLAIYLSPKRMDFADRKRKKLDWNELTSSLQEALKDSISLTSLTFICLMRVINIPQHLIRFILRIQTVFIYNSDFYRLPSNDILHTHVQSDAANTGGTTQLSIGSLVPTTMTQFFNEVKKSSVTHLQITGYYMPDYYFNISTLTQLVTVSMSICLGLRRDPVEDVVKFLKTAGKGNVIRTIMLVIYCKRKDRERLHEVENASWRDLDDLLSSDVFTKLRVVELDEEQTRGTDSVIPGRALVRLLPKLNEKGILKITIHNDVTPSRIDKEMVSTINNFSCTACGG